ncbi:hypothetical protein [Arenibaculum pallidiluteum]|uniref:hypothetical protein n=1 Tax=Arenibaculum pallidiluteum TaxID=2812559 RepID=UPI001A977C99|nr:hypothetical protein [Arenibaculum pallidiluteum]
MSESYAARKVREALAAADGSRARAQRLLLAAAVEDERLLKALVAPFMKAIVTAAVDKAARAARQPKRELPPEALDRVLDQMAARQAAPAPMPRRALSAPSPAAAQTAPGISLGTLNTPPPTKAGDRHVQTMKALALLYKRQRDR